MSQSREMKNSTLRPIPCAEGRERRGVCGAIGVEGQDLVLAERGLILNFHPLKGQEKRGTTRYISPSRLLAAGSASVSSTGAGLSAEF